MNPALPTAVSGPEPAALSRRPWFGILVVLLLTFAIYVVASWGQRTGYFAHTRLAEAMLHGSFSLTSPYGTSEVIHDAHGHAFIAYGVTPAFLLIPFVAIFGPGINQTLFSDFIGAITVALWWAYLGRRRVAPSSRAWLTTLFAFGSPFFFYSANAGDNWAITHTVAIGCTIAALYLAERKRFVGCGLALGMAVLSRIPLLLLFGVFIVVALAPDAETWREVLALDRRKLVAFASGFAVSLAIGAYYNWARFGTPLQSGYGPLLRTDPISNFGRKPAFALHYAAKNVPLYLFGLPGKLDHFPWWGPTLWGMSVFITMPILLLLWRANWRKPANLALLAGIGIMQGLYFVFIGTGSTQFGMRYANDYLLLAVLLVCGICHDRFDRWFQAATILGIGVEVWGLVTWRFQGW